MSLRAGMPVAVIAEIGSRSRIVGTIGLHAVSHRIVAGGSSLHDRTVVIVLIVVVAGLTVIAIALRGDRAADQGAGHCARYEAAATAMMMTIVTAAAVAAAPIDTTAAGTAAAAKPRAAATTDLRGGAATSTE